MKGATVQEIGPIVRLQVQRSSLKVGEPRHRRYDPAAIVAVPALRLTTAGAVGEPAGEPDIVDVHNADHPQSKQRAGVNGLSVGFTGHYAAMQERFGDRPAEGIAGENLIVESGRQWTEDDLAPGLLIRTAAGDEIPLVRILIAAPCVEFTRWAMQFPAEARPDRTVTESLQFLGDGMRGFYFAYDGAPVSIAPGDRLFIAA